MYEEELKYPYVYIPSYCLLIKVFLRNLCHLCHKISNGLKTLLSTTIMQVAAASHPMVHPRVFSISVGNVQHSFRIQVPT